MRYNELVGLEELNTEKMNDDIMVTILCVTYNHAPYIEDAFKGFINQKTNFRYEVVVFDDASTDGTSQIVLDYQNRFPNIIHAAIMKRNLYGTMEWSKEVDLLLNSSKGKYFALCEGDDFWTDSGKIQLQVKFMEENPQCSMTVHEATRVNLVTGEKTKHTKHRVSRYLNEYDIINQPYGVLPTASMVVRREVMLKDPLFPTCDVGDYPLQLFALTKGKIYFFNNNMSVYRYLHKGSWGMKGWRQVIKVKRM